MKTYLAMSAVLATAMGSAAFAATEVDANADGMVTLEEAQAQVPEITAEIFSSLDVNADGALDADEVAAAQDAGIMPKTNG